MKRLFILLTIAIFTVTGCTGTFQLTRKVNNLHRSQPQKWVDELIFLGCVIVPVYAIGMLGDAIIFNSIEFWTGSNPIADTNGPESQRTVADGTNKAVITYNDADDSLKIESGLTNSGALTLHRSPSGVTAMDSSGNILYTSSKDEAGGVSVYDGDMKLVKYFSPEEVLATRQSL